MTRRSCVAVRHVPCLVVVFSCLAVLVTAQWGLAAENAKIEANVAQAEKTAVSPAVSQAALAARLALEGEKRKSPILMLAAAEILGNLKEGQSKSEPKGAHEAKADESDKEAIEMDPRQLADKAVEYAKGDKELSEFVTSRLEQLSTRGLVYSQGAGLPSFKTPLGTFKLIDADVLSRGETTRLTNVRFEGGEPAVVLVIGDGDGDLDLWVYDENSGGLIKKDTDTTSECMASWTPRYTGPFTIRVKNVGSIAERYVVVVNW